MKVYGLLDGNTWILNQDGYANQMNMDGSEPSGFYWSDWRNGVTHDHPNQPLREFYFSGGDEQWYDNANQEEEESFWCYDQDMEYYYECSEGEFEDNYGDDPSN